MANLQVQNVPDALHQRLRDYARKHKCTLSDFVLTAIERELDHHEWRDRLQQQSLTNLGKSAASLLEEERRHLDEESG